MAPSKHACLSCSKIIREKSSSIGCCICKKWFHKKCSNLSDIEFKKYVAEFRNNENMSWQCSGCSFEVSIVESDDECNETEEIPLSTSIKEIEKMFIKYLAPFKEKMEKLERSVTGIRDDLNKFTEQNKMIAQQQRSIETRIIKVENKITSINELASDPNNLISEINERIKREKEVIILNVPESKKPVGEDRRRDDIEIVTALIPTELSNTVSDIKLRRLGKPSQGKIRPVLLYTPSNTIARTLLKSKPTGDSNIKFKPSLTQAQQQHLNKLRSELDEVTKNGNPNKTIKYVNGVPKIVNKHTFRTPKEIYKNT